MTTVSPNVLAILQDPLINSIHNVYDLLDDSTPLGDYSYRIIDLDQNERIDLLNNVMPHLKPILEDYFLAMQESTAEEMEDYFNDVYASLIETYGSIDNVPVFNPHNYNLL
jgi:hypothetical protein